MPVQLHCILRPSDFYQLLEADPGSYLHCLGDFGELDGRTLLLLKDANLSD